MRRILALSAFAACLLRLPSQDIEPVEPDVLLPEELLKIELPEPVGVDAGIPLEEELSTDLEGPLFAEPENPVIREPELALSLPNPIVLGVGVVFPAERALSAEVFFGAGSRNHINGRVHLYQLGSRPTFELDFGHDAIDGFGANPPGSSHYMRVDELEGRLGIEMGPLHVDGAGTFHEAENGLQEESSYGAMVRRTAGAEAAVKYRSDGIARLTVTPGIQLTTLLWKGEEPDVFTEVVGSADLLGELVFEKFRLGLTGSYTYRDMIDRPDRDWDYFLHRVSAGLVGTVNLPQELWLEARSSWFYSQDVSHLFPFSLRFGGRPAGWLVFSLGGGYRVQQMDLHYLLSNLPFLYPPQELVDNHGWFGSWESRIQWSAESFLEANAVLGWNSNVPLPTKRHEESGLFPLEQEAAVTLEPEVRVVWSVSPGLSLRVGWEGMLFLDDSRIPFHGVLLETSAITRSGNAGGTLALRMDSGPERDLQAPDIGLSGFYRFNEDVRVIAEISDILFPFLGGPRYSWKPFQEPGIRFTTGIHIRL